VDAVGALVDDEPRRASLGEGARALAVERYSWPRIARRLEEIYEGVVGRAEACAGVRAA
jgi:glycosyltransferase involved in cell wall biosynthesis